MKEDLAFANELLKRLETKSFQDEGADLNDLASQFRRGFPVEKLGTALKSDDIETVEAALYVASELGSRAVPLVGDILPLAIKGTTPRVKYRICDICLVSIPQDNRLVPAVSNYLIDESWFVRFFAIRVFVKMDERLFFKSIENFRNSIITLGTQKKSRDKLSGSKGNDDLILFSHMLWLISVLRSALPLEDMKTMIRRETHIEPDLRDAIIDRLLPLLPRLRRKS